MFSYESLIELQIYNALLGDFDNMQTLAIETRIVR